MSEHTPATGQPTVRLTTGQALVRFLAHQWTERDGARTRMFAGCFGIFGHGNVAGVGQGLLQSYVEAREAGVPADERGPDELPYYLARNEQGMVHAAVGYARARNRTAMMACAASIGPGSTNMLTGAALATIDHIPVLLLPSDVFANRVPDPVLQQLELPTGPDVTVNDAFRPLSRYFDRIWRPEQLIGSAVQAMRVLADPAETGAVTLALPQDVQAQAFDWPLDFFADRTWHIGRPVPQPDALGRAVAAIRAARRPLLVAGGGAVYSGASAAVAAFADATGIPVADTQAGKGAIAWDHPAAVGGLGSTGSSSANALAAQADLVIGVGTRYTDFTTASHTAFGPATRFVNVNVAGFDAAKHGAEMVVADAREALTALTEALAGHTVEPSYREEVARLRVESHAVTDACYAIEHGPLPAQTAVLGVLNEVVTADDVLINAAGSAPGDLQQLFRASRAGQYHLEYGFSCMGYEIPAAMGVKLARPDAEVYALVGDAGYQMAPAELATLVSEGLKVIVVLVQNHGYASIGSLSESRGSERFGTAYRTRNAETGLLDGGPDPVDLAANAASLGADVLTPSGVEELRAALAKARASDRTTVVVIETDSEGPNPPGTSWWDVPVSETSTLPATQRARAEYERDRTNQRYYL